MQKLDAFWGKEKPMVDIQQPQIAHPRKRIGVLWDRKEED